MASPAVSFGKIGSAIGAAIFIALALIFVLGADSKGAESATDKFLRIGSVEKFPVDRIIDGETVCLIPSGIDPVSFLAHHYQKAVDREFYWDSDTKWYVLAILHDRNVAKVMDVDRSKVDSSFDNPVCSSTLVITIKNLAGKQTISATHGM